MNIFLLTWADTGLGLGKRARVAARRAIREVCPSAQVSLTLPLQDV
ncbi:hypothetical protein [Streptomyces sp. NBC_00986]|nr:hypothetical protein OG504_03970 [Streptomyces sp. NBC_00986]